MAFGFIKSIFSSKNGTPRKDEPEPGNVGPINLREGSVLKSLREELSTGMEKERENYSRISTSVMEMLKRMSEETEKVRWAIFEKGDRQYAPVNVIKDAWVKKMENALTEAHDAAASMRLGSEEVTYQAFADFYKSMASFMSRSRPDPKQKIILDRYFTKETERLMDVMKSCAQALNEAEGILREGGSLKAYGCAEKLMGERKALEKELDEITDSMTSLENEKAKKEETIRAAEAELKTVETNGMWKELEDIGKELKELDKKKGDIEHVLSERFGGLKRIFKKYSHDCKDLGKDEAKLIEDLAHSPVKTVLSNESMTIEKLMLKMQKSIESGEFKLPDKDRDKAYHIKELVEGDWLREAMESISSIEKDAEDAEARKSGIRVEDDKKLAEAAVDKARSELDSVLKDTDIRKVKMSEKAAEIMRKDREVECAVKRDAGVEIIIGGKNDT